jgi:hypothetical protein
MWALNLIFYANSSLASKEGCSLMVISASPLPWTDISSYGYNLYRESKWTNPFTSFESSPSQAALEQEYGQEYYSRACLVWGHESPASIHLPGCEPVKIFIRSFKGTGQDSKINFDQSWVSSVIGRNYCQLSSCKLHIYSPGSPCYGNSFTNCNLNYTLHKLGYPQYLMAMIST